MSHEYYVLFYSTVFTNQMVNPRSHESKSNRSHRSGNENRKLEQRFLLYAALYPLSYREVVAILYKMALKNRRRHLRQNRLKNYFAVNVAVNGKIDTTFFLLFTDFQWKKLDICTCEDLFFALPISVVHFFQCGLSGQY